MQNQTELEPAICDLARRTHTADVMIERVFKVLQNFKGVPVEDALRMMDADIEALVDLVTDSANMARNLRSGFYGEAA